MKQEGIKSHRKEKWKQTTNSRHDLRRMAQNKRIKFRNASLIYHSQLESFILSSHLIIGKYICSSFYQKSLIHATTSLTNTVSKSSYGCCICIYRSYNFGFSVCSGATYVIYYNN